MGDVRFLSQIAQGAMLRQSVGGMGGRFKEGNGGEELAIDASAGRELTATNPALAARAAAWDMTKNSSSCRCTLRTEIGQSARIDVDLDVESAELGL